MAEFIGTEGNTTTEYKYVFENGNWLTFSITMTDNCCNDHAMGKADRLADQATKVFSPGHVIRVETACL